MILLDSHALVALLGGEPAGDEVRELLRGGDVAMTSVNLAEAIDVLSRRHGIAIDRLEPVIEALFDDSIVTIDIANRHAWRAARIRGHHYHRSECPLSLADCLLLAAAGEGDSIATADSVALRVAKAEGIATIPLRDSLGRRP